MAKADSLSMDCSRSWKDLHTGHVTTSSNRIGREEIEFVTQQDEDGDTPLHIAVAQDNMLACHYLVAVLLNTSSPFDIRNKIMQTPLHVSCLVDSPDITRLLLRANPLSCDVTDRHGNNCIHLAVKHSSVAKQHETLKAVLEVATPNALEKRNLYGYTPMHLAAIEGKAEAIRLLKKAGANINALDNRGGASSLILATRTSQREAAQALLELGANPTLRTTYGETASQLASGRADHVISELLALYDSSCDVMKASALPRYTNANLTSSSRGTGKQVTSRHRDVKMKPFVNVTSGYHANIQPLASAIRHVGGFSSPPPEFYLKTERRSPASSFPSNISKQSVVNSNRRDEDNRAADFAVRRVENRHSNSPAQQRKRKNIENDGPLDLSVKKAKANDIQTSSVVAEESCIHKQPPRGYVFAQPSYIHPTSSLDRSNSHVYISTNRVAPIPTTPLSKSSNAHQTVLVVPPHSPVPQHGRKNLHYYVQLPDGKIKEAVLDDHKRGQRQTSSSRQITQHIQKHHLENSRNKVSPKNGLFYPLQMPDPSLAGFHGQISGAYDIVNAHLQQPIRKVSFETRDKLPPTTKLVETRDQTQPLTERVLYARDQRLTEKHHSTLGQTHSLPNTLYHRKSPADEAIMTDFHTSTLRDRRYQSDGACYDFNRFLDKQSASRRNSAPVAAKSSNVKLDLRSYTGCLPPHYLHLLESSGNLPTRPSNALRNVADVLRDNIRSTDVTAKQEISEKKKATETQKNDVAVASQPPVCDVTPISVPSPAPTSSTPMISKREPTPSVTPSTSPPQPVKVPVNNLSKLGDWSDIESGKYPAFGNPPQLEKDKIKASSRPLVMQEFTIDEKYMSDKTRAILRSASAPKAKKQKAPNLRNVMTVGTKHSCRGCSEIKKKIPSVIADIWRYRPSPQYVTSASTSSEVVYCAQLDSKNVSETLKNGESDKLEESNRPSPNRSNRPSSNPSNRPSPNRYIPSLIPKTDPPPNHVRAEQLNLRANSVQRSVTGKLVNHGDDVTENGSARDDMLDNVIEASDDDDDDDDITKPSSILNNHVTRNSMTTCGAIFPTKNGFHDNLTEVIKKTLLQNLERHNDVVRKLRSVQAILTPGKKEVVKDSYKDYHISDLEISDDEEMEAGKKSD